MKRTLISILLSTIITFSFGQSIPDILEKTLGAVVTVGVYKTEITKHALGFQGNGTPEMAYEKALDMAGVPGSGSGFIIEKNGKLYVITNAHIIEDASDESGSIYIYSVNRSKYEVNIVGGDSFYDIAVLEFVDEPGIEISSIQFRDNDIRIGEKVYAIGNTLGEYPYTVTDGIISAKNRMREGMTGKFGFMQTTATIIWGNSGGPLIDINGKVAGINSQIAFAETPNGGHVLQSQINFALEAGISNRIVNDIITNNGRVRRAFIGVEISQKHGYKYTGYNYVPVEIDAFPVISGTIPGSPASSTLADKINWQVKKINGKQIRNLEEVLGELENVKPGSSIIFSLENDGFSTDVSVNTGELKAIELEHIARYILNRNKDIVVDYDQRQLTFKMKESNFYYHNEKELYRYEMTGKSLQDSYYILAAGIYTENTKSMWLIENIQDMGAAFRLTGSAGLIDFYVLMAGNSIDDIELLRLYLSGDKNVTKSTIWY
jgi:S1-C subfamily serine protease